MWPGGLFKYQKFWTINILFSVQFSDCHSNTGPFDNRTQIYLLNTRLVWYSDAYCITIYNYILYKLQLSQMSDKCDNFNDFNKLKLKFSTFNNYCQSATILNAWSIYCVDQSKLYYFYIIFRTSYFYNYSDHLNTGLMRFFMLLTLS